MNDLDYIGANELVFNSDKESGIYSGGFSVNSIMMKAGLSPIMTINTQTGGTNKVSDLFESLVVPNWALSYSNKIVGGAYKDQNDEDSDDDIDDDLHDKLLDLVKEHEIKETQKKKRKTRKQKINANIKKGGTKRRK
jgi:hypothetical protein